ncbi:long-chain fatty acid transport protein [Mangrovivirga sp. M17]|uniref:Long-chain fatty acid transport protein n=1 Tax=Mangrovivirga halotolerans TaxID=2993936 RepID=A0ABT3RN14_9BACT|nr:long-chain fatty acid transport protein [Mangrovivirga halotolerans]MCX2742980.1 long-chain fatty acid transport protein [Mangrovivirga halotolerans]
MKYLILLVLILSPLINSEAQSSHFWTRNYGSESMLLSGSVIGGVSDLGAVYYNPARLALTKNPAFIISADVYELNSYKIEDAVGNRADLKTNSFGGAPSLAAGSYKIKKWPKHHFAYAVLLRHNNNLGFTYREEVLADIFPNIPGEELFEGEVTVENNSREEWFGGSWAYRIKENLSVGVSLFATKSQVGKGTNYSLRALTSQGEVAIYDYRRNYGLDSYGLLAKFGIAYSKEKLDYGLTITTPRLHILGDASYNYQFYFSTPSASTMKDIYANNYQNDINIKLRSPLSIGVGTSYSYGKDKKIHLSAEYFHKVNQYNIFEIEPHTMQSRPDSVISFRLVDAYRSILNVGIGAEWYLSDKVRLYGSFSTDFSAAPKDGVGFMNQRPVASNSAINANYFHAAAGVLLSFKGADFTLGATHTGGKTDFSRPVNIPDENNTGPIVNTEDTGNLRWDRWQFIVSFSVPFLKDYAKKLENKLLNNDDSN